jgi:hypothetical protein
MVMAMDPNAFLGKRINVNKYNKLKGVSKPTYHIGGYFFRDEDGNLG